MKAYRWALAAALCLASSAALNGCGAKPVEEADGALGAKLYRGAKCDTCHGPDGGGLPRIGPKLEGLAQYWTRDELVQYLLEPAPFRASKPHLKAKSAQYFAHMSPFPGISAEDRGAIADWLLARFR